MDSTERMTAITYDGMMVQPYQKIFTLTQNSESRLKKWRIFYGFSFDESCEDSHSDDYFTFQILSHSHI